MVGDIERVKAWLLGQIDSAAFNSVLDAVNLEHADLAGGYQTPYPASLFDYAVSVNAEYPFPILEILAEPTQYDEQTQQPKDLEHEVSLIWSAVGDQEDRVTRDVERLIRATRDRLHNSVGDGTAAIFPVILVREDYSQTFPNPTGNGFLKSGRLIVKIQAIAA